MGSKKKETKRAREARSASSKRDRSSRPRGKGPVRYAIVGAGNIAQVAMLPAFAHAKKSATLVAIVSSDPKKRKKLCKKYGVEHAGDYDELEAVLAASRTEAVYVSVPNHLHREMTERSLAAGAHVLCEKPMAMTVEDCDAMIGAAKKADKRLMIAYRLHLDRATRDATKLVSRGKIGDARYFSSTFSHQIRRGDVRTQDELGGGALFDLGPYCINAARHLFAAEPTEVFAYRIEGVDARSKEVDEATTAIMKFPDDRIAQFTVSQGAASVSSYRIVGTKGDLRVEPGFEYVDGIVHYVTVDEKTKRRAYRKSDQFAPQLEELSRCIRTGRDPESGGEEGLADVRVLAAIAESAASGKPVALAPRAPPSDPARSPSRRAPPVKKPKTVRAPSPSK